jgi:hypothetical protein
VTLNCLSLWYEEKNTVYTIEPRNGWNTLGFQMGQ